jgi:hypothetical protein
VENVGKRLENIKTAENTILCVQNQDIIQFLQDEHQKTGKVPSIRGICERFGMSSKTLYEFFPGRKTEMCAAAGVPLDADSFKQVAKASQALKTRVEKEFLENEELNVLRRTKETIAGELKQAQLIDEARRGIIEQELQFANTYEGKRRLFSNPQRMLQFAARTVDYESFALENPKVWDSFVTYCKTHGLDLAQTLFQVAGRLEEFEKDPNGDELHKYLGFEIEAFLIDRQNEQRQKEMQAKFENVLRNLRCDCGRRITSIFLDENKLSCPCGTVWMLKCVNCSHVLQFDTKRNAFYCLHCKMSFKVNVRE